MTSANQQKVGFVRHVVFSVCMCVCVHDHYYPVQSRLAVSLSPWHSTSSVAEPFGGRMSFLKTECVVFSFIYSLLKADFSRAFFRPYWSNMLHVWGHLVTWCCFAAPFGVKGNLSCQTVFWHLQQVIFRCLVSSI